jgi:hypothetical protein
MSSELLSWLTSMMPSPMLKKRPSARRTSNGTPHFWPSHEMDQSCAEHLFGGISDQGVGQNHPSTEAFGKLEPNLRGMVAALGTVYRNQYFWEHACLRSPLQSGVQALPVRVGNATVAVLA